MVSWHALWGGWQVISWSLILSAPFTVIPTLILIARQPHFTADPLAWSGFAYVAVVSQFLGFFPWYRGMALAGVARVGQIQLFQPFLTLVASALLLGEHITLLMVVAALVVCLSVWVGRNTTVRRTTGEPSPPTTEKVVSGRAGVARPHSSL